MGFLEVMIAVCVVCFFAIAGLMLRNTILTRRELQEVNTKLKQQATRDELTGLWNRRALIDKLEKVIIEIDQRCVSLLMIDLDHFKEINDEHGHVVGDEVLEHVAGILRRSIRRVDFAARYGGEEFLIIVMDADGHYAEALAERIRHEIEEHPDREHDTVRITASIGVIDIRGIDDPRVRTLLEGVDKALYMAKKSGRNRVFRGDRYLSSIPPGPKLPRI